MILILKDSFVFSKVRKGCFLYTYDSADAWYDRNLLSILFVIKLTNHTMTVIFAASHPSYAV